MRNLLKAGRSALLAALAIAIGCGAWCVGFRAARTQASAAQAELAVTDTALELGLGTYNNVGDTKVWFKAVVTFNADATVATGGNDAGAGSAVPFDTARLGKVKLNGAELGTVWADRGQYLQGKVAQQKIEDFFYADWLPDNANGKRALMLIMPVEYYSASGFGFKGDGTDSFTFPAGADFTTPEGASFAEETTVTFAMPTERISVKDISTRETDLTYNAEAQTFGGNAEVLIHFDVPNAYPAWSTAMEGKNEYTDHIFLNGKSLSAIFAENNNAFFLRNNSVWDTTSTQTFAWHATLMLYLNPSLLTASENRLVVAESFPLYKGLTLSQGYAFSVSLDGNQAAGSRIVFEQSEFVGKEVIGFDAPAAARTVVGKTHGLPDTVGARTADGSLLRDLAVRYDWDTKQTAGEFDLIGSVTLPAGYVMQSGAAQFQVKVTVDHYIASFEAIPDAADPVEIGMGHGLPATVKAVLENGEKIDLPIAWNWTVASAAGEIPLVGAIDISIKGTDRSYALADNLATTVNKTITVVQSLKTEIASFAAIADPAPIKIGEKHGLPTTITATLKDGTTQEFTVQWSWTTAAQVGDIKVVGTVAIDYDDYKLADGLQATLTKTVTVQAAAAPDAGGSGGCNGALGASLPLLGLGLAAGAGMIAARKRKNEK